VQYCYGDADVQEESDCATARADRFAGELGTEQLALIAEIIEDVRPGIRLDGGDIELVEIAGDLVRVRLTGACIHCALAGQTLGRIRRRIIDRLGVLLRVLPAPID
jgi:Fe-S cluster biogenesis protein NfuA